MSDNEKALGFGEDTGFMFVPGVKIWYKILDAQAFQTLCATASNAPTSELPTCDQQKRSHINQAQK